MDGITGLSPQEAQDQIYAFYNHIVVIANNFHNQYSEPFIENLAKAWCSPKAVEFFDKHYVKIYVWSANDFRTNICTRKSKYFCRRC